tara:strand:- start:292 stop:1002 length:711 start_codon:yes stop_codon:yes gene_type:complete
MKQCSRCKKNLPYSDFYMHGEKSKNRKWKRYYSYCKKCDNVASRKWKKENYEQVSKVEIKRRSELIVYLREKYNGTRTRSKRVKKDLDLSWFNFLRVFITQMRITNFHCMYNPEIKLTHKVGIGRKGKILTNISVDRLDNDEWYSKTNLIFCSWSENDKKGAIDFDGLAVVQMWALFFNKDKWRKSTLRAQNYIKSMRNNKQKTLRSIRNEMEQDLSVSKIDTGTRWQQTSLFDQR